MAYVMLLEFSNYYYEILIMFNFQFQYYAECHAVIYIVDSSDRERVSESKETFGQFSLYVT